MDGTRLIRALMGLGVFGGAAYLFEPSLFGGRLPNELMDQEPLRNVLGVGGAMGGILLVIDALFPKTKPAPAYAPFTADAADVPPEPPPLARSEPEPEPEHPSAFEPAPEAVAVESSVLALRPPAPEAAAEPQDLAEAPAEEPVWGAYVAPDEDTLNAARSLVESEFAPPQPGDEPEIGQGLPPPPPKPD